MAKYHINLMKYSIPRNIVLHFETLLPIVTIQTNRTFWEAEGIENACQILASTENKLRLNAFLEEEKKQSISKGKQRCHHHNNHQEGPRLPNKASATAPACKTSCNVRVTGTRPHPFTSLTTQKADTQL